MNVFPVKEVSTSPVEPVAQFWSWVQMSTTKCCCTIQLRAARHYILNRPLKVSQFELFIVAAALETALRSGVSSFPDPCCRHAARSALGASSCSRSEARPRISTVQVCPFLLCRAGTSNNTKQAASCCFADPLSGSDQLADG